MRVDFHLPDLRQLQCFFGSFLQCPVIAGELNLLFAQNAQGGKRATRVEVAEINTRVLTDLIDVQGRVIEGPSYSGYGYY